MSIDRFVESDLIKYISDFCTDNYIRLDISSEISDGDYFDAKSKILHLEYDANFEYSLFIASHEYGHAYQYINNINSILPHIPNLNKLIVGSRISVDKRNDAINTYLLQEHNATVLGLQLLRKFKIKLSKQLKSYIYHIANIQLIKHYMRLRYSHIDGTILDDITLAYSGGLLHPCSEEFYASVRLIHKQCKKRMQQYINLKEVA